MVELAGLMLVLLMIGGFALVIKKCWPQIKKFWKDPTYGAGWEPTRTTKLERRIEDANAEIEWLKKNKSKSDDPLFEE